MRKTMIPIISVNKIERKRLFFSYEHDKKTLHWNWNVVPNILEIVIKNHGNLPEK